MNFLIWDLHGWPVVEVWFYDYFVFTVWPWFRLEFRGDGTIWPADKELPLSKSVTQFCRLLKETLAKFSKPVVKK